MSAFHRVALINVRIESRQRIPIGLLTLAACIKDHTRVSIFDPEPTAASFDDVVAFQPDLIGIGFMTQTRFRAKQIYDRLRQVLPQSKMILGGVGPTVEKEYTFSLFQPDAIAVGEGERTLQQVVAFGLVEHIPGLYRPEWTFLPAVIYENLDELPLPAYECMPDFEKYLCPPGGIRGRWFRRGTPMIMTGRGCPFRCTFCSSCLMFGRRVRRRSAASVISELRRLHDDYAVDSVYFFDDTFNAPRAWVETFCEALSREPYRLTWGCQIRVNAFDVPLGKLMRRSGCVQVDIGAESGSPRVLRAIHKDETVEQIEAAFQACHTAGLAPMGTFLVGCPEETHEDVALTQALIRRIRPSFAEFFYLIPYPGSELYAQALEKGWLVDRSYEGRGMVDRPVMRIHFSLEEQVRIRREYFKMMAFQNIKGYLAPAVLLEIALSLRVCMLTALVKEYCRTRNIRDAMQAFVHALRGYYARRNEEQRRAKINHQHKMTTPP